MVTPQSLRACLVICSTDSSLFRSNSLPEESLEGAQSPLQEGVSEVSAPYFPLSGV